MAEDGGVDGDGSWRDGRAEVRLGVSGVVGHVFVQAIGARKPDPLGAFSLPLGRPSAARPGRGTSDCAHRIGLEQAGLLFHVRSPRRRDGFAGLAGVRARRWDGRKNADAPCVCACAVEMKSSGDGR
jgi:hypothetical protein